MANPAACSKRHKLPGFSLPLHFTPNDGEYITRDWDGTKMATIVHPAVGKWGALFPNALEHPSPGSRHVLILLLDQNPIDTWL